ncbi:SNF2 family N-terminal domain-containing protein [Thamnidium elegans]|uniref:Helicase SWR1 n=1 Tax=Thamnidium elegans TaxID=101142 RepID=A0A8H7VT55_9FUNG|nr:hypothetical protein INT48_009183 [Thamnidium elegans]KAI8082322.1 SNF2 family N-terminal domain-containing protein [Thamnidium elegans]
MTDSADKNEHQEQNASPFKLTKRALLIEEKLKSKPQTSLFDTDGDLSRHNIIEGGRRSRRRTVSSEEIKRKPKRTKLIANAKQKLMSEPKSTLDTSKNDAILSRIKKMEAIKQRHDASVKELYHLELFQNMLDYKPAAFINDVRYNKYMQDHDLWEYVKSHHHIDTSLIDLLSSVIYESTHNIPNTSTLTINSGTGIRRHNRQFLTLKDYLNSFVAADEGTEDLTVEQRNLLIEKERSIRQRLYNLEKRGGFSTNLQMIANRRPQQTQQKLIDNHHDTLIMHMQTSSKLFHVNAKYKRNAARRCAKAVERYWENIRTHDERIEKDEQKRLKRLAKWTSQQIKKKWKIVERVCEARLKEVLKEQQAKEGRRHLELILEHSEHMLGVRKEELRNHQQSDDKDGWDNMVEDERDHIIEDDESDENDDELRELEEDQNLSVEELMNKYRQMQEADASDTNDSLTSSLEEGDDDAEFSFASDGEDVPIEEDGESEDDDAELNALNQDADLSVEELLRKYKNLQVEEVEDAEDQVEEMDVDPKNSVIMDDDLTVTDYGSSPAEEEDDDDDDDEEDDNDHEMSKKVDTVVLPSPAQQRSKIQPTGNTLSTTKVYTKIPFLLRGTLREYQHVGLDWLASLYNNGINGILADEMGLGKTIQTIALLAYLACEKQVWGPHLIVVPTSVILNWEMELKKWLPGFKIMTYYGTPKERKEKRSGWSKDNAFHVCITSYQLVLQDQNAFRRKQWQYLILDEAHHIKNFRSQRWQVLLNFNSKRRLLLTGTPLQNNLMELWSLLYFLMPNGVSQDMPIGFANLKEFQEWFSNPVDRMIENQQQQDEESRAAIQKLHTVLRPYLLRRLKADVEKQMPEKHEHIVYCRLSKRQRYLYDDFMGRGKTKETLASGNFLSIINCLMQLRKVCNHPDLFEERPILTSFAMNDDILYLGQSLESKLRIQKKPLEQIDFGFLNLILMDTSHNKVISQSVAEDNIRLEATKEMMKTIARHQKRITIAESRGVTSRDYHDLKKYAKYREMQMHIHAVNRWQTINYINHFRCARKPMYDANLIQLFKKTCTLPIISYKERIEQNLAMIEQVGFVTPKVVVYNPNKKIVSNQLPEPWATATNVENDIFHPIESRLSIAFPDKRLLQYDCGKLQKLDKLLRDLAAGGHRALIFTQMTRVLDVLETFLNMHGHRYLRLDGATKVEQRQILTEHFNNDKRILCFILSTRSGGLGINLTGADTVIFYDSDWNPSMDKQCQDRAHRIGQTRDVHIYRFVTEFTIEENIFKKANQKRLLDNVIIQQGDFTDDYFHKNEWWKDLPEVVGGSQESNNNNNNKSIDYEQALLEAEDEENDAAAAIAARKEMNMDDNEFKEDSNTPRYIPETPSNTRPSTPIAVSAEASDTDEEEESIQLNIGHVDQYMLQFWEREVIGTNLGFGGI